MGWRAKAIYAASPRRRSQLAHEIETTARLTIWHLWLQMDDTALGAFDKLDWFDQPDQHARICQRPDSITCISPGTSTIGGSAESSVLLAITPTTSSLSSFLEPRVCIQSINNSLTSDASMNAECGRDIDVIKATAVQAVDSMMFRKMRDKAPRLTIIPLPRLNVEVYSSSPSVTTHQENAPRLRRSKSIVFVEDDGSEASLTPEEGNIGGKMWGDILARDSPPRINSGLGLTIEHHLTPQEEPIKATALRRVDGCLNLKSLWLEVSRAVRSPGMTTATLPTSRDF